MSEHAIQPAHPQYRATPPPVPINRPPPQPAQAARPATAGAASALASPVVLSIVGGFLSVIAGMVTTIVHLRANIEAEQAKAVIAEQARKDNLQAELIRQFIEHPDPARARDNLVFLANSGLLPDYGDKIAAFLKAYPNAIPHVAPRSKAAEPGK